MWWRAGQQRALTSDESQQLVERLVVVVESSLPIGAGLRASAGEVKSGRLRRCLEHLADGVERGESLDHVLQTQLQHAFPSLHAVLQAAIASGRWSQALSQYADQQQVRGQVLSSLRSTWAYPLTLLVVTVGMFFAFSLFVLPDLISAGDVTAVMDWWWMVRSESPAEMLLIRWWALHGAWYVLAVLALFVTALPVCRVLLGPAKWQQWKQAMPMFGPVWRWLGIAEWSRLVSLFLACRIPLSTALLLASQGVTDARMRRVGRQLAQGAEEGGGLSGLLQVGAALPSTLTMIVRHGEQGECLAESLTAAAEYFEERARLRLSVIRLVFPPLMFVLIAVLVVVSFGVVFKVITEMINWLDVWGGF